MSSPQLASGPSMPHVFGTRVRIRERMTRGGCVIEAGTGATVLAYGCDAGYCVQVDGMTGAWVQPQEIVVNSEAI